MNFIKWESCHSLLNSAAVQIQQISSLKYSVIRLQGIVPNTLPSFYYFLFTASTKWTFSGVSLFLAKTCCIQKKLASFGSGP